MQTLDEVMAKISSELEEINEHRREYERCINTEDSILSASNAKLRRNTEILESTVEMCRLFEAEYVEAENARKSERHLLGALKTMMQARIQENF